LEYFHELIYMITFDLSIRNSQNCKNENAHHYFSIVNSSDVC
jgi:hypothetical protein